VTIKCPKCQAENPETKQFCGDCGTQLPSSRDIHPELTETLQTPIKGLTRGTIFASRYEIIEELGTGGMGKVYRVFDKKIEEEVAFKLIKPEIAADKKTVDRFRNEIKTARKITHQNVCRMHDLNEEGKSLYITMEYVPGEDLKSFIRRARRLDIGTAISIAKQVCEGLTEAHRLGVVHRDLKPSNIMIDKEGNAKIMDFGIARFVHAKGITGEGVIIGTPEYMSTEQLEGEEVDQRSDIYSLGVILYEMVTGRIPFEGDTPLSIAVKHRGEPPKDPRMANAQIPKDLAQLILKCLDKNKNERYQEAKGLLSELIKIEKRIPTAERVVLRETPKKEEISKIKSKNLFILGAIIILLLLSILGVRIIKGKQEQIDSIAVLPFESVNELPDTEYLSEGVTESLITKLSQLPSLKVISRFSVFQYKGKKIDLQTISRELNVRAVLMGRIIQRGEALSISVELVNTKNNRVIWSEQYNQKLSDIFAMQEEISKDITEKLKLKLTSEEQKQLAKRYTGNTEAYQLYLKGRYYWNKRTEEGFKKAIEYFEQAIEKDPLYALGYAGLADCYDLLGWYGHFSPSEAYPKAKVAANKALEIDDKLAEAHASLAAFCLWHDWDWPAAEREFKRAIEISPGYAIAHLWYADCLTVKGRSDEAIAEMKRAQELDPLSLIISTDVAKEFLYARKYDQAIQQSKKTLELDPNFYRVHKYLGIAYLEKSMIEEAIAVFQKAKDLSSGQPAELAWLGYGYGMSGRKSEALKIHEELGKKARQQYISAIYFAVVHIGLGDKDRAFEWLERAYNERSSWLIYIHRNPLYDSLHSDSRYKALLKKMRLE
jgi:serine/threonine-protein kinase